MNGQNKTKISVVASACLVILFLIPYLIVNHLPFERMTVPFILHEDKIPFLPWTFLVYFSALFFQEALILLQIPKRLFPKILWVGVWTLCAGLVLFALFPIRYPRELYPSTNVLINFVRMIDSPANCFPSLHVTGTILFSACFSFLNKPRAVKILMWVWTFLIIVSVLTTKQHYLIDVFGGIALAVPGVFALRNIFKKNGNT